MENEKNCQGREALNPLLEVKNLKKHFPIHRGFLSRGPRQSVKAVDGVSFSVYPGETLGLVGESGCGKTTLGRLVMALEKPTEGEVYFEGKNIFELPSRELRALRKNIQIIFQDPFSSLNPRMTVEEIVQEPLDIHAIGTPEERKKRAADLLDVVGLPRTSASRHPHEFSGGQRQRVGIARALALNPKLIVADEPVSALDVSIQAQVINLLQGLKKEFGLTYLFVAHDISVVKHVSDRIAVMYLGKIVETAPTDELFTNPQHPYTEALLSAIPLPDPGVERRRKRILLEGDVPSPIHIPSGCRFHTRCRYVQETCKTQVPEPIPAGEGHWVECPVLPFKEKKSQAAIILQ